MVYHRSELRTLPTGKYRSELFAEDFHPAKVEEDHEPVQCSMTGKAITLGELRNGQFQLVDPVSGHLHWAPDPKWTLQGMYLKELTKMWFLPPPFGPDCTKLWLGRALIMQGTQSVTTFLSAFYDTMALVAALLITVAVETTFLDDDAQGQCQENKVLSDACNTQVLAGIIASAACIIQLFWCILFKLVLNVWPPEAFAHVIFRFWYLGFGVTIALMLVINVSFVTSFQYRIGLQTYGYDSAYHASHTGWHPLVLTSFWIWMAWPIAMFLVILFGQALTIFMFRKRDLEVTQTGFSNAFLNATGVLSHTDMMYQQTENPASPARGVGNQTWTAVHAPVMLLPTPGPSQPGGYRDPNQFMFAGASSR